jgi:hypothetical protein
MTTIDDTRWPQLPYEAVRQSAEPDQVLRAFIDSTYAQAADLGRWDRAALDRRPVQEGSHGQGDA